MRYKVNYKLIDRYIGQKHIVKASFAKACNIKSAGWYSACKSQNCKMTEEQLKAINNILRTKKAWDYLVLKDECKDNTLDATSADETITEKDNEKIVKKEIFITNDKTGGIPGFIRIIEPLYDFPKPEVDIRDELVRVADVIKIYKGEGECGKTIHYDVLEHHNDLSVSIRKYISEFDTTPIRDIEYEKLVRKLTI